MASLGRIRAHCLRSPVPIWGRVGRPVREGAGALVCWVKETRVRHANAFERVKLQLCDHERGMGRGVVARWGEEKESPYVGD